MCTSVCVCLRLSVCVCQSVCLSVCMPLYLVVSIFLDGYLFMTGCVYVCLSAWIFVYLSVFVSVYLSVCLLMFISFCGYTKRVICWLMRFPGAVCLHLTLHCRSLIVWKAQNLLNVAFIGFAARDVHRWSLMFIFALFLCLEMFFIFSFGGNCSQDFSCGCTDHEIVIQFITSCICTLYLDTSVSTFLVPQTSTAWSRVYSSDGPFLLGLCGTLRQPRPLAWGSTGVQFKVKKDQLKISEFKELRICELSVKQY